jgi:hypothetical protein
VRYKLVNRSANQGYGADMVSDPDGLWVAYEARSENGKRCPCGRTEVFISGPCGRADCPVTPSASAQRKVWIVSNKTSFVVFGNEAAAQTYVSAFPASVGGGMDIAEIQVVNEVRVPDSRVTKEKP